MPLIHKRISFFVLPVIVFICSILGGFYGPSVQVAIAASNADAASSESEVAAFSKFYSLIDQNFAEPLKPEKAVYKGAVPGMLRTLDPHSNFFDPKDYRSLMEEQKGSYSGVGMSVSARNGKTVVIAPFPGSPAYKAGLRPGDVIVAVNDKPTENLTTTEVADILKGPKDTSARIVVSREGAADYLTFNVTRGDITRKSVPEGFMVRPGIAYIKILNFAEATGRELEENLQRLGESNLKALILDLRDNPGGLLNAGVRVSDHFLQKGQLIVSHRGRSSPERTFVARTGNKGLNYPIVVLVNRSSASAAEIVSGALQDHDRAWILGETTFGKGLVQSVFPLQDNTGLALTIAHFYTPSGRLIQREYNGKTFYDYYFHKDDNARNPLDVKMTDSGRTVYGGGGITPDEKFGAHKLSRFETELYRSGLFNFTRQYFAKRTTQLPKGWMPDDNVMQELHEYLKAQKVQFTEDEWTKNQAWIRRHLAREMYIHAFDVDASDRMFAMTDPAVERAIEALPKATALVQGARRASKERQQQGKPAEPAYSNR